MNNNRINFTKKNIESLPLPDSKHVMYHDTRIPGLVLRVFSSGIKSYSLFRRIEGKPENITIGRYPDITPEQARREATILNGRIADGNNPAEEKRGLRKEITLGVLFKEFLDRHAKKHKRTWKYDERMFDLYFSHWENRQISKISRRDVQTLHVKIGKDHGEQQANRACAMLHTVYEKAREWDIVEENPCFKLRKFQEQSRERYLSAEELTRFFEAINEEQNEIERDFFLMLLFTGARKSNVLQMAWKDIDLDLNLWIIPATKSKNKSAYTVPFVTPALEILKRRQNDSPWVFPSFSKSGHLIEPKRAWKRILTSSEIENLRMHDLRRTLGTWMAISGSSLLTIAYALGHKIASLSVTAVYARANVDTIRVAMEKAVDNMLPKASMIQNQ